MDVTVPDVNLEEDLDAFEQPITLQSDFDTAYAAIARRSLNKAEMLTQNPDIAKALDKILMGLVIYCKIHDTRPEDLEVGTAMSFEGRIVTTIRRP